MSEDNLQIGFGPEGVATVALNRPQARNALDSALVTRLTGELWGLANDPAVRVVVLAGNGPAFCAGADIGEMERMGAADREENLGAAEALASLLRTLNTLPKPTVARVHGPAYGGAVGLVSACDIAIATPDARFCLSEVRLGVIPAVISPYVVGAIGPRFARRYFLTAEVIEAAEAERIGLVHRVVPAEQLDAAVGDAAERLLKGGPHALAAAKNLVADVAFRPIDDALVADTARRIADIRAGGEAQEGLRAFLDKRKPAWMGED